MHDRDTCAATPRNSAPGAHASGCMAPDGTLQPLPVLSFVPVICKQSEYLDASCFMDGGRGEVGGGGDAVDQNIRSSRTPSSRTVVQHCRPAHSVVLFTRIETMIETETMRFAALLLNPAADTNFFNIKGKSYFWTRSELLKISCRSGFFRLARRHKAANLVRHDSEVLQALKNMMSEHSANSCTSAKIHATRLDFYMAALSWLCFRFFKRFRGCALVFS